MYRTMNTMNSFYALEPPVPRHLVTAYSLLALIFGPNLYSTHGTGSKATVTNPKRLVAQPIPSLLYICIVNNGKTAPSVYLNMPLAAAADAPAKDP